MNLLSVDNVSKSYGNQKVLKSVSFDIDYGKIYLIKGRSGSGKSTLLNICSFLENPDTGMISFENIPVLHLNDHEKKKILRDKIGYIFQDFNLFEDFSVYENLKLYLLATSNIHNDKIDTMIKQSLSKVGLEHKIDSKAKLLSGGERQRVTLARTLLLEKKIIFADEPSANIDDDNVAAMVRIFKMLREQGTSILIVTHDDVFDEIGDHLLTLESGVIR